jgi:hypothetical protein
MAGKTIEYKEIMLNLSDPNALVTDMVDLRTRRNLWEAGEPEHECDKRLLTSKGKEIIIAIIKICLQHNVAPLCSISGENGSATSDIVSLNPAEFDDLIAKVASFATPTRVIMGKPPESYLDAKRPPLQEAMVLEGGTINEAIASLKRKGYFELPPGPWQLRGKNQGENKISYDILDCFGDFVARPDSRSIAELIVSAVNIYRQKSQNSK